MSFTATVEGNNIKIPPGMNLADGTKVRIELPNEGVVADDLSALIGSWQDDAAFDLALKAFEQMDEAVWK